MYYGTWTTTTASLSDYCHFSILLAYTLQLLSPLFLPFSNPRRGLLFPLISPLIHSNRNFTSSIAEWCGSALLQVQGSLASPALHQCTSWRSKLKKTCIFPKEPLFKTCHINSNPLFSMRALGLNVQLLQWLAPSWDRTLGNGKIWFLEGSILKQTAEISLFKWLYLDSSHIHGKLCSVPTDVTSKTSSWISQEQTLTLRVEQDTKQTEKQGVRLGTIWARNGFESQELGISVPAF